MDLQYGIIGPGAVGTTIAYELLRNFNSNQVHLFGKKEGEVLYQQRDTKEKAVIHTEALARFNDTLDVLFIAVKTHQLDRVIEQMEHVIDDDTVIILAQNGHGQIEKIEHPHVYQAVVYISGQKTDESVVHFRDRIMQLQEDEYTIELAEQLADTRLEFQLQSHIETYIWYKLLVNLGINSVTAVGRQTASILKVPEIRNLCRNLLEEGQRIAEAAGIVLPETIVEDIMKIYAGYPDDMGTSMYYDIINGAPLEVDAIQGFIYRTGQSLDLYTPYLETIYSILAASENGKINQK
ncbi:oxidoreductase [Staphylococcus condimenti]|uniref:2-dehydropantoate 2-reductase n=1 Tax=Staphylococcus condimenti TaxID=70255 RepID=A0A4V2DWP2_9STAP|nr:oxidoreductase [Staphylococcus condimenti]RZI01735.1 oxidoreductase [Staphylococcus condimenti]RZI03496.1 oxidoreductase [Staphylococcus condimenti]